MLAWCHEIAGPALCWPSGQDVVLCWIGMVGVAAVVVGMLRFPLVFGKWLCLLDVAVSMVRVVFVVHVEF